MRLVHLADLHLDAAFQSRSRAVRASLRDAARDAFSSAVEQALSRQVDAVLIAGDLFDGDRLSVYTERFLSETLARLAAADLQVVYASGNHDPGEKLSELGLEWPEQVTVVDGPEPVRIEIRRGPDPVGFVTAAGHSKGRVTEDLSRRFPTAEGPLPEVALLHTQVHGAAGERGHEPYAPSELSRLSRSGFDYWALGHVHTRQVLSDVPAIHYSGNTQGRNPRETGPKGGLFVDLARGELARPEFMELGPIRWETLPVTGLEDVTDLTAAAKRIEAAWEEARAQDPGMEQTRWILRVELTGPSALHRDWTDQPALEELGEALASSLDVLDLEVRADRLTPTTTAEAYAGRTDVLGEALRLVATLADQTGPSPSEVLGLGQDDLLGLASEAGEELDAYLRDLLKGGETPLLEALLREDRDR